MSELDQKRKETKEYGKVWDLFKKLEESKKFNEKTNDAIKNGLNKFLDYDYIHEGTPDHNETKDKFINVIINICSDKATQHISE